MQPDPRGRFSDSAQACPAVRRAFAGTDSHECMDQANENVKGQKLNIALMPRSPRRRRLHIAFVPKVG